jgi:hypothetical protein
LKWSTNKIGFDEEDHPISTKDVGTIPLLCSPTINNIAVNRTLIDGGAGLNIISVEVFEKMQVPYHRPMPNRPFFGVTEGSTMPIGQVHLPITFGTRDNYRSKSLDFDDAFNLPGAGDGSSSPLPLETSSSTPFSSISSQSTRSPTTSQNMKDYSLA